MADETNDLGATPQRSGEAGSIAPEAAPHVATKWYAGGRVVTCEVGGFLMIRAGERTPPVAYVAGHDDAYLIAAAPDYDKAAREMIERHDALARAANFTRCGCHDCKPFRPIVAKAEGRS